jgi:hypothetical protein
MNSAGLGTLLAAQERQNRQILRFLYALLMSQ